MSRARLRWVLLASVLASVGCAIPLKPQIGEPTLPSLGADLLVAPPVELRNGQDPGAEPAMVFFVARYRVDLHAWTERSLEHLNQLFSMFGGRVEQGAEKTLELSIVKVSLVPKRFSTICVIDFNVHTGDGYARGFQTRSSAFLETTACKTALGQVAPLLIGDQAVIDYLQSDGPESTRESG